MQLLENRPRLQGPGSLPDQFAQLRGIQQRILRFPPPILQRPPQSRLHVLERRLPSQILGLIRVALQVIQLHKLSPPRLRLDFSVALQGEPVGPLQGGVLQQGQDQLVSSIPQGALGIDHPRLVRVEFRGQRLPPGNFPAFQQRHQGPAGQSGGLRDVHQREHRGQQIDRAHQLLAHPGTKPSRPAHQQGHPRPRLKTGNLAPGQLRTVVAEKDDQRVLLQAPLSQHLQHLSHNLVETVYAGEIVSRFLAELRGVPAHKGKHSRLGRPDLDLRAAGDVAGEGLVGVEEIQVEKKRAVAGRTEKPIAQRSHELWIPGRLNADFLVVEGKIRFRLHV